MATDVIAYWAHGAPPADIMQRASSIFTYPVAFVQMPDPPMGPPNAKGERAPVWNKAIESLGDRPLNKVLKDRGIQPSRIALLGFSASCTAERLVLDSADGGYIDTAIAIDGIHAGVDVWADFAELAAFGGAVERGLQPGTRSCIITHSQVQPSYTSTTETAAQIIEKVFGGAVSDEDGEVSKMLTKFFVSPVTVGCSWHPNKITYDQMPFWYQVNKGGLHVLGYENRDETGCTDHIFQAKVILPRAIEFILAPRWHQPPPTGTCMTSV